jgi:4-oxalocrotonate tautomerase
MPLITVKLPNGLFSPAQKREMVRGLMDTMAAIEGEPSRGITLIMVEETIKGASHV